MWPCARLKYWQNCEFWSNLTYFEHFFGKLWPKEAFFIKLRPEEHFSCRLWPFDQFKFETPALKVLFLQRHFSAKFLVVFYLIVPFSKTALNGYATCMMWDQMKVVVVVRLTEVSDGVGGVVVVGVVDRRWTLSTWRSYSSTILETSSSRTCSRHDRDQTTSLERLNSLQPWRPAIEEISEIFKSFLKHFICYYCNSLKCVFVCLYLICKLSEKRLSKMKSLVCSKRSQAESWWFLITKIYISCYTD